MDSKATARAKEAREERGKESATIVDQPGTSRESARTRTRAKAKTKDCKENAVLLEKLDIQPANGPRAKEMIKENGATEGAKEHGAKEDSREEAKADRDEAEG